MLESVSVAVLPRAPGPSALSPAGILRQVRDPLGYWTDVAREYGPVARLPFDRPPAYLLGGPEEIGQVHLRTGKEFDKGYEDDPLYPLLGNGLVNSEGEFWRRQRRLVQPAFHRERIDAYARTMVSRTERMLGGWREGERRDAHEEMMRLTLGIVAETLFGVEIEGEAGAVGRAISEGIDEAERESRRVVRLPAWVPMAGRGRLRRAVEALDRVVLRIIAERRIEGKDRGDLLSMLLAAQDEDGAGMTDRQLRDEAMTLFIAGHETTALALTWTWALLSRHAAVEEALLAELREVLDGRSPTVADVRGLRYAEAVIKESMRLYPPIPVVARRANRDVEIGGYLVPSGTQLVMCPWIVQRDARYFPAPETFDPSRWLGDATEGLPKFAYFPFGGGPRKCIGTAFAMVEATLLLATIAQKFRLQADGPVVPEASIVTVRPRHGVPVRLISR